MAITESQRAQRKGYIGSSDVGAICGLSQFANAYDIWLDKTGRLNGDKSSVAADLGTDMEIAILNMFDRRMNRTTERNIFFSREEGFPACANLDGALFDPGTLVDVENGDVRDGTLYVRDIPTGKINAVVEAKSTSMQDEWGDRTGDVPLRVICQTQWQMWVADAPLAYVPVLFPDFRRFRLEVYRVERNDELIEELVHRARIFWTQNVLKDVPPDSVIPHLETLKRVGREPQSTVALGDEAAEILQALETAKAQRKAVEQAVEQHQAELLALLCDAEAGRLPDGSQITYLEQNGGRHCDFDLLLAELQSIGAEQIYEKLVSVPRFRVLRHRKAKRSTVIFKS